jgi:DNA-binding NarL/FixJ family response regulator
MEETANGNDVADRSEGRPLGIVLVDNLPVVRAGMSLLISRQQDLEVLAEATSGDEALEAVRSVGRRSRLVILVGLGLEGEHDSFWLIRRLREEFPAYATIGLGAKADQDAISRALFVGADGFVDKTALPSEFLEALKVASEGEMVLVGPPTEWLGSIAEGIERQRDAKPVLTHREWQVLAIASEGLTAKQIGDRLGLAERTVTTHLGRIYGKLGVSGRVAAIASAARAGFVASPVS